MGTRPIDRRRFVQLTGTALAVALAGCAEDGDTAGPGNETNGNATGTSPMDDTATGNETSGDTTEDTTTEEPTAFLRAVHAVADAPAVDVYVDGERAFSEIGFGTVTQYAGVAAGDHDVQVTVAGDPEAVVFDQTVSAAEGFQSVVAYGELGIGTGTTTTTAGNQTTTEAGNATTTAMANETTTTTAGNETTTTTTTTTTENGEQASFGLALLSDRSEAPNTDEALVRVFHASPDAPAVDVTIAESGEALFTGLSFGDGTDYEPVPGGDYTLEVRPETENNDGDVVAEFDVSVEGGTAYSTFATGYVEPSGEQPALDLLAAVDGRTGGGDS